MWTDARPLLEVHDLHVEHPDGTGALRGASLHVGEGEIVGLVGPPGAGKSTLLLTLCGLVPVTRGRILFDDRDITGLRFHDALRAAGITLVGQYGSVFPGMSVRENLELGMVLARDRTRVRPRIEDIYRRFPQLAARARSAAGELDPAERRMLELGRALMPSPRLVVLDALGDGLPPDAARQLYETIDLANRTCGLTVLAAEAATEPVLAASHRAYLLEDGRLTLDGTGAELAASPAVERALQRR
ncbi:MAG: ATP-binding cassette domain-containing protein [Euzebyales bacterium]|nr:ATP-binding cassette domain-containing protein [Euzebyales bacterium]